MRAHFTASHLVNNSDNTYRQLLTELWNNMYPQRQASTQVLSKRVRWMMNNEKISKAVLDAIRRSCWPRTDTTPQQRRRSGRRSVINAVADDSEDSGDVEVDNINDHLARNLLKYKGATPSSRPKIPRMTQSKEMMGNVETINHLSREQMDDVSTLHDLVHLVYAGLVTVCEIHGTLPTVEREEREGNTAPWKVRLEGKTVKMR
ncbi:hypothetical protein HHI36_024175 [Cryptolaemus montrouzieri]|uniref:Uncharacterized protein n=1 Tax=Cryptolaemus montrouzieri TaxID=559131 RepID=A0ABD2NCD1_9CUCU